LSSRFTITGLAFLILAESLIGQIKTPDWINQLLPADARLIESADLTRNAPKGRVLALRMAHPNGVPRPPRGLDLRGVFVR
jgi:hypothetical protein